MEDKKKRNRNAFIILAILVILYLIFVFPDNLKKGITSGIEKVDKKNKAKTDICFDSVKVSEDIFGSEIICFYFTFTNNDKTERVCASTYDIAIYQNGVELDDTIVKSEESEKNNMYNSVLPNTSTTICKAYKVPETNEPLKIIVKTYISDDLIFEKEIKSWG